MKKYAVAHMDFFDNDLKIAIVEASSPVVALIVGVKRLLDRPDENIIKWLNSLHNKSVEEIKQDFFEADQSVAVEEIK